jgi:3-oxoacyl-[acyl-carrier protein] reductase
MGQLDGRNAIVTGGSRGIGRAIVSRFVAEGADVVFTYRVDEAAAEQVAGERARPVRVDLAEPDDLDRLYAVADETFDGLDIVVNNAAVSGVALIVDVTDADYDHAMAVNAKATFRSIQHAARRLRDGGRIVNISTPNTRFASPGNAVYSASKAAVEQFSVIAARELGGRAITVNVVTPGATDTDMLRANNTPEGLEVMRKMSPLGRLGTPDEVAAVVAFLAGPDSGWITGQNINASGGV